jgi:hypothetical protein
MDIIMAKPTATSAAATTIIKIAKICPVSNSGTINLEKATIAIFTPLSISSIDIRMTMALRLARAPYSPIENKTADSTR